MSKPLVSVIVPVYKVEKYINRAVDSLINQTYRNLEIILVDDGSPDGCPSICDNYAKQDHRIKVIHKQNGGLSDARNSGISIATGEYITFVDSDDYVAENYIEILASRAISNNADIVCAGLEIVNEKGVTYDFRKADKPLIMDRTTVIDKLFRDEYPFNFACSKLYKRKLWNDVKFPIGRLYEDMATTYRVMSKASTIVGVIDTLYYYEQGRPGNISSELNSKKAAQSYYHGCINAFERIRFCQTNNNFKGMLSMATHQLYIWSKLCIEASTKIGSAQYKDYCDKVDAIVRGAEVPIPLRLRLILAFRTPYYYIYRIIGRNK